MVFHFHPGEKVTGFSLSSHIWSGLKKAGEGDAEWQNLKECVRLCVEDGMMLYVCCGFDLFIFADKRVVVYV